MSLAVITGDESFGSFLARVAYGRTRFGGDPVTFVVDRRARMSADDEAVTVVIDRRKPDSRHPVLAAARNLSPAQRDVALRALRELDRHGIPFEIEAALITNAVAESGLDPGAVGDTGKSVGIYQLRSPGLGSGMSFAERSDAATASARIAEEFRTGTGRATLATWEAGERDVGKLTAKLTRELFRPTDKETKAADRAALAMEIFPGLATGEAYGRGSRYGYVPSDLDTPFPDAPNFTPREVTRNWRDITNKPSEEAWAWLAKVARLAQRMRAVFGPLEVTSGYRSPELNAAVYGWPAGSRKDGPHTTGKALDLVSRHFTGREMAAWLYAHQDEFPELDKAIWYVDAGHVHVQVSDEPRHFFYKGDKANGTYVAWPPTADEIRAVEAKVASDDWSTAPTLKEDRSEYGWSLAAWKEWFWGLPPGSLGDVEGEVDDVEEEESRPTEDPGTGGRWSGSGYEILSLATGKTYGPGTVPPGSYFLRKDGKITGKITVEDGVEYRVGNRGWQEVR
jgi:hypothetical protein